MATLEKELETYNRKRAELIAETEVGKYVLIHGEDVIGVFGAYEDALKEGYEKFGLAPFLVKKIEAVEQVQYITRNIGLPCHT
jgi:hypothetical protein